MGDLRNRTIEVIRAYVDGSPTPPLDLDYDEIYPVTTFSAVRREMADPDYTLVNELAVIRGLINKRYEIVENPRNGYLMTFTNVPGEIGTTQIKQAIDPTAYSRSNAAVVSEAAVGAELDKKASASEVASHINNRDLHLTLEQREALSSVVPDSTFREHVNNSNVHVSGEDRVNWDGKANQSDLLNHMNNYKNPHKLRPEDIGTYSTTEIDAFFDSIPTAFFNYLNIWVDPNNSSIAKLVAYNPNYINPTYVISPEYAGTWAITSIDQYILQPDDNDSNVCNIYRIKAGTTVMSKVGSREMKNGDMVSTYDGIYVWQDNKFKQFYLDNIPDSGTLPLPIDPTLEDPVYYWYPSISGGVLSWSLRSASSEYNIPPSAVNIRGPKGEPGEDGVDGAPGIGIPPGGAPGNILVKGGNDGSEQYNYVTVWADLTARLNDYFGNPENIAKLSSVLNWNNITGRPTITSNVDNVAIGDKPNTIPNVNAIDAVVAALNQKIDSMDIDTTQVDRIERKIDNHIALKSGNPHGVTFDEVLGKPTSFAPSAHASTHSSSGSDPITPEDIGAISASTFAGHTSDYDNPHRVTLSSINKNDEVTNLIRNTITASQLYSDVYDDGGIIDQIEDFNNTIDSTLGPGVVRAVVYNPAYMRLEVTTSSTAGGTETLTTELPFKEILKNLTYNTTTGRLAIHMRDSEDITIDYPAFSFNSSSDHSIAFQTYYTDAALKGSRIFNIEADVRPGSIRTAHLSTTDLTLPQGTKAVTVPNIRSNSQYIATTAFVRNSIYGDDTPDTLYPKDPTKDENAFATYNRSTDGAKILSASLGKWLYDTKLNAKEVMQLINNNLLKVVADIDTLIIETGEELTKLALSASIGKYLYENKANLNHAYATGSICGMGSSEVYGHTKAYNHIPTMNNGSGSAGTDDGRYAMGDHVHPTDTSRAPVTFTTNDKLKGLVKADHPEANSNDDRVATTKWVRDYVQEVVDGLLNH